MLLLVAKSSYTLISDESDLFFYKFFTRILIHCFVAGIFVALALRFDVSRGKESQYFKSAFFGYVAGVVLTIIVMNWFQAAQVITGGF